MTTEEMEIEIRALGSYHLTEMLKHPAPIAISAVCMMMVHAAFVSNDKGNDDPMEKLKKLIAFTLEHAPDEFEALNGKMDEYVSERMSELSDRAIKH